MTVIAIGIVLLLCHDVSKALSFDCPGEIEIRQEPLVPRPSEEVELTCNITNVSWQSVSFYWWLISEGDINNPIVTYLNASNKPNPDYSYLHITERLFKTRDGITSTVKLEVNLTNFAGFTCEFQLKNGQECTDIHHIRFEDAALTLDYTEHEYHMDPREDPMFNVTCRIPFAVGKPRFELLYSGTEPHRFKIIHNDSDISNKGYYYDGLLSASIKLPQRGNITCRVNDTRGTYNESIYIDTTVPPTRSVRAQNSASMYVIGLLVIIIAICVLIAILWWRRAKGTSEMQEGFPLQQDIDDGFTHKNIRMMHITPIKNIDPNHRLFGENGPSTSDVIQTVGAQADSWFLASLYSLCLHHSRQSSTYLQTIFGNVDLTLNGGMITIKIWNHGRWQTADATLKLPTQRGKLCFTHSEDKSVFWSALLQKAFFRKCSLRRELNTEWDVHCLEDLTGGVVYSTEQKEWTQLKRWHNQGYPMTCVHNDVDNIEYYSITDVEQDNEGKFIRLRAFSRQKKLRQTPQKASTDEEKLLNLNVENEYRLSPDQFGRYINRVSVLLTDMTKEYEDHGHWELTDTTDDFHSGEFWKNPQYIITCDTARMPNAEPRWIFVALMQKLPSDANVPVSRKPLKIGLVWFKITDHNFLPEYALNKREKGIRDRSKPSPEVTREMGFWVKAPNDEKHILIPYCMGGDSPADFLLRVYVPPEFQLSVRSIHRLPRHDATDDSGNKETANNSAANESGGSQLDKIGFNELSGNVREVGKGTLTLLKEETSSL